MGCFHGPLPKSILPVARAPRPEDPDRVKDGLRGPVQRVLTLRGEGFEHLDEYDGNGRILHRADKRLETWFRYDALGRLVETVERDPELKGNPTANAAAPIRRTLRELDAAGRLIVETTFDRDRCVVQTLRVEYDAQGRRALETEQSERDSSPDLRRFHYDAQGRVSEEIVNDGVDVTFVRYESPNRTWRATYHRTKSQDPPSLPRPPCPWPAESPLGEEAGETLVFSGCHLTVTDDRGYLLERTSPGSKSECHRYNEHGHEVTREERDRGPGCGWMVTIQTPHDTTESRYEYDPQGNWIRRFDVITTVDFPSRHGRREAFYPLVEVMESNRSRQDRRRIITYFPVAP